MIKFFRKIRQDLLSKGKTGKYFKYAVGEILLVMVGILLALQVNNWNETNKQQTVSVKYLENLKKEVILNENKLKIKLRQHQFVLNKTTELLDIMSIKPKEISSTKLDTLMFAMALAPKFTPIKTFISSEELGAIKNDSLKNLISLWSFNFEKYTYDSKIIYDLYYNYIYDFMQDNYQMKNVKSIGFTSLDESDFKVNSIDILGSATFENHVTMKMINANAVYSNALTLSNIQKKIIIQLDEMLIN